MSLKSILRMTTLVCASMAYAHAAFAGVEVVPLQTNIVDTQHETTFSVVNKGDKPMLVQVWATPHETIGKKGEKVPVLFSPPLFRVDPGVTQKVRAIYTGGAVKDQQLYRLDVQEVPEAPKTGGAVVQFAFRHVLPLTVGNAQMDSEDMAKAVGALKWYLHDGKLTLQNNSVYAMIFGHVKIGTSEIRLDGNNQFTVAPHTSRTIPAADYSGKPVQPGQKVSYQWFNAMHVPVAAQSDLVDSAPQPNPAAPEVDVASK